MKKTLLHGILKGCCTNMFLLFGLFVLQPEVFTQETPESTGGGMSLKFGVKVGATISSFDNQQPHNNLMAGFAGGGFVAYPINSTMEVQAEALFAQEGGRLLYFDEPNLIGQDYWYVISVENERVVINMLNVPVLFKYHMPMGNTKLSFVVGPNFGYRIHAKAQKEVTVFTESGSFHTYTETDNLTSNIERYSLAATAGAGVEIDAGGYTLILEGRYKYGITPVFKSYSYVGIPQISGDLNCHSVIITLGIGF